LGRVAIIQLVFVIEAHRQADIFLVKKKFWMVRTEEYCRLKALKNHKVCKVECRRCALCSNPSSCIDSARRRCREQLHHFETLNGHY
jgi:hypothetical protein